LKAAEFAQNIRLELVALAIPARHEIRDNERGEFAWIVCAKHRKVGQAAIDLNDAMVVDKEASSRLGPGPLAD
jgi:hypothetical protein